VPKFLGKEGNKGNEELKEGMKSGGEVHSMSSGIDL
jgi:hypothetical protein